MSNVSCEWMLLRRYDDYVAISQCRYACIKRHCNLLFLKVPTKEELHIHEQRQLRMYVVAKICAMLLTLFLFLLPIHPKLVEQKVHRHSNYQIYSCRKQFSQELGRKSIPSEAYKPI